MGSEGEGGAPTSVARPDLAALLICSVGYSLGRRTYVVNEVCRLVRAYHAALEPGDVRTLLRYLDTQAPLGYGDPCDAEEWRALRVFLAALGEGER